MIRFQFCDSCLVVDNGKYLFENFKQKLRGLVNKPKHVFAIAKCRYFNNTVIQWNIVYDLQTRQVKDLIFGKTLTNPKANIGDLLFDVDTNQLISCDKECKLRIWSPENCSIQKIFTNEYNEPACATWYFSKNKKYVVIGFSADSIEIWDWETKQFIRKLDFKNYVNSILVDEENEELLTFGAQNVERWSLRTFSLLKKFNVESIHVAAGCFINKNKTLFACGNKFGRIKVWDKQTGECLYVKENAHEDRILQIIYSLNLNLLICRGRDNNVIKIWNLIIFDKEIKMKFGFEIVSPFSNGEGTLTMKFLDPILQDQILVKDSGENWFIVDLILKRITWKKEKSVDQSIVNFLIQ